MNRNGNRALPLRETFLTKKNTVSPSLHDAEAQKESAQFVQYLTQVYIHTTLLSHRLMIFSFCSILVSVKESAVITVYTVNW
jgi:hypothetical protein